MKKLQELQYDILAIVFSTLVSIVNFLFLRPSWNLQFDSQMLLLWNFTAYKGILPFKNIFYPYGLLYYYKDHVSFFSILYYFLPFLLLMGYYFCFKQIFKNNFISIISLLILIVATLFYVRVETLSRYGIFALFTSAASILFWKVKYISKLKVFGLGIITGVFFSLTLDQGIYCFLYSGIFIMMHLFIKNGVRDLFSKKYSIYLFRSLLILSIGFFLGTTPFLIYLLVHSMFFEFVDSFLKLFDITLYAKTPYFHSLRSWQALFNILILILGVSYISFRIYFISKVINKQVFLIVSLLFTLLLLEQKSIIRSIDNQLLYIGILLALFLFFQIYSEHFKKMVSIKNISIVFLSALFILLIQPIYFFANGKKYIDSNNTIYNEESRKEVLRNVIGKNHEYYDVYKWITNRKYNAKVFTFPSDPVFYILFNQEPPYYLTSYESSPKYAQERQIKYIKENADFIIVNSSIHAVQDGVPDALRVKKLNQFILRNFQRKTQIKEFTILKK